MLVFCINKWTLFSSPLPLFICLLQFNSQASFTEYKSVEEDCFPSLTSARNFFHQVRYKKCLGVLRRWRNRKGRPLSPPQIHLKNIWRASKFHRTTFECWQRTSGTQKGSPLSSKGSRRKYTYKKRDKRGRDWDLSQEGSLKKGFQTPGINLTWIWENSGRQWRTEKPGKLQSMGLQRVGHNLIIQ